MVRPGRVYLFGDGSNRINPIHGADLADVCADALESAASQIDVGGPEVLTYHEIAELAFAKVYGPVQFMASVMTMDVIGQPQGQRRLADHFRDCSGTIGSKSSEDHPLSV